MGCFPFCCCFKNIEPQTYVGTVTFCNVFKLGISIGSFFFLKTSIVEYALYLNIFEFNSGKHNSTILCNYFFIKWKNF